MEDVSVNVLVDAKTEYTKQLTSILSPIIFEGFVSLYEEAIRFKDEAKDPRYDEYSELQIFQDYLRKIPKWNQDIIDKETDRVIAKSKCEWLEDLLAAVFISNAKVLSVIRTRNPSHQMKLKIPKLRSFIHKCYVECSREIYQNVYLFDNEEVTTVEKQKNVRDTMNIIKEGIVESVRKLLPVQEIIKTYLGRIYDDDTDNTIQSGFEENLFRDFAKNKLRKEIQENTTTSEDEKAKSSESSEDQEETSRSSNSKENRKDKSRNHSRDRQADREDEVKVEESKPTVLVEEQKVEEIVQVNELPSIDDLIKIKDLPDTPVSNISVVSENMPVESESFAPPALPEEILKTIVPKEEFESNKKENTDNSLTHENVKKIVDDESTNKEQRRREREERHRAREERRRLKDEKRKRKLLRNKDKMAMEQERNKEESETSDQETLTQTQTNGYISEEIKENKNFSFGGPVYNEDD